MRGTKRTNCFYETGSKEHCNTSTYQNMLVFCIAQLILSQISCFDKISWLSTVAAVLSFTYPTIGLGLGIAKIAENRKFLGSITGVSIGTVTQAEKIWRGLQALGAIAFVNSFSVILIEIPDTLKSPSETKTMTRAILISEVAITLFNMLSGCIGYAAFGSLAPENVLTGFGFYNPYWLLDIANVAMFIHLIITYQVYVGIVEPDLDSGEKRSQRGNGRRQRGQRAPPKEAKGAARDTEKQRAPPMEAAVATREAATAARNHAAAAAERRGRVMGHQAASFQQGRWMNDAGWHGMTRPRHGSSWPRLRPRQAKDGLSWISCVASKM